MGSKPQRAGVVHDGQSHLRRLVTASRGCPRGRRKNLLEAAAEVLFTACAEQVLPFDKSAAGRYGQIVKHRKRAGRPLNGFDAQIAAICQARHADLATRNLKDFEGMELSLINPWQS